MEGAQGSHHNIVVYMECLRARDGKVGFDGCKMFLPEPSVRGGFICAKCGCSRECHRKMVLTHEEAVAVDVLLLGFARPAGARSGGGATTPSSASGGGGGGKTRMPRTNFTEEQKRQMIAFSERLGWKTRRKDRNNAIKSFCNLLGVRIQSFKTWMRKNGRRPSPAKPDNNTIISISSSSSYDETSSGFHI